MSKSGAFNRHKTDRPAAEFDRDGSWQRWQMDELQQPPQPRQSSQTSQHQQRAAAARQAAEQARKRDAEKRQALYDEVRRKAEEEGYQAGFERGRQEGQAQGLDAGREQAQQELEQQIQQAVAPLEPLARQFTDALEQLDDGIAQSLVELALETGKHLAGDALDASPEYILRVVRDLLHTEPPLVGQQRLWLNADDHDLVARHLGDELNAAGWKLQPDAQLGRGSCRVTSAQGDLDATFESRWQAINTRKRKRDASPTHSSL
ncbi:flagellar assembly protein FliH [Vreelandella subglaciescola]|uniref:Flagellar assembly protein FliH n=1 Tax=Vreelandella subglaciescola TaxID=29571 RepID=A0A1M7HFS6_9GAMM|nr:flagellar assembly protein FliH [Halomonas subglaciescola]SHM27335.1 flagellar assembly protein FliH [Halomonas subglaciescola]